MHPDLTTMNSLEGETAPTSQKRKWEAQRGKVDTGKSLSFCENLSWGSLMPNSVPFLLMSSSLLLGAGP